MRIRLIDSYVEGEWIGPGKYKGMYFPRFVRRRPDSIYLVYMAKDSCSWPLWNAVAQCERLGIKKEDWVRDELQKFAQNKAEGKPFEEKENDPRTDWLRDAKIVVGMDWWIRRLRGRKPGRDKVTEASQRVAEEFERSGERIQASTIRAAYYTVRKRFVLRCIPRSETFQKPEPGEQIQIP